MYINIDFKLPENIVSQVQEETQKTIEEILLKDDKKELKRLVQDCVKSQVKCSINELLQSQDFRRYIFNVLIEQLNMKEDK